MQYVDTEWVIWLDADTLTHSTITEGFLDSVSPKDCVVTHLRQRRKSTTVSVDG